MEIAIILSIIIIVKLKKIGFNKARAAELVTLCWYMYNAFGNID